MRQPRSPRRVPSNSRLVLLLAAVVGCVIGMAGFTFRYAEGLSYFSTDPKACANCHIMNDQYASWTKGPHHGDAALRRLPPARTTSWPSTSRRRSNGYHHSKGFTLAGLPRADPDQAAERGDPSGRLPALPRRPRPRRRWSPGTRGGDDGSASTATATSATAPAADRVDHERREPPIGCRRGAAWRWSRDRWPGGVRRLRRHRACSPTSSSTSRRRRTPTSAWSRSPRRRPIRRPGE